MFLFEIKEHDLNIENIDDDNVKVNNILEDNEI